MSRAHILAKHEVEPRYGEQGQAESLSYIGHVPTVG